MLKVILRLSSRTIAAGVIAFASLIAIQLSLFPLISHAGTIVVGSPNEIVTAVSVAESGDLILLSGPTDYDFSNNTLPVVLNKDLTFNSQEFAGKSIFATPQAYLTVDGTPIFQYDANIIFRNIRFNGTEQIQNNTPALNSDPLVKTGVDFIGGILKNDETSQTELTVSEGLFYDNTLTVTNVLEVDTIGKAVGDIYGGAIYQKGTATQLDTIHFEGAATFQNNIINMQINMAAPQSNSGLVFGETKGGAIYSSYGNLIFDDYTVFDGNQLNVTDNVSTSNRPKQIGVVAGSAIYAENSGIVFKEQAEFTNNHSEYFLTVGGIFNSVDEQFGGAFYLKNSNLVFMKDAEFSDNTTRFGIFGRSVGLDVVDSSVDFLGNASFANNIGTKSASGAAIYTSASSEVRFHSTSSFVNNGSNFWDSRGGAIYNAGNMTFMGDSEFRENKIEVLQFGQGFAGGAIYNEGTINFQENVDFSENNIRRYYAASGTAGSFFGGAIYNKGTGVFNFQKETTFSQNKLYDTYNGTGMPSFANQLQGGALSNVERGVINFYAPVSFLQNTITYDNSTAALASRVLQGGAIYNEATININSSAEFLGNSVAANDSGSTVQGGAICIAYSGTLNFNMTEQGESVLFQGNTANGTSNAIYMEFLSNLNLNHVMGTDVYFYDPIDGGQNIGIINQTRCGTTHFINNTSVFSGETNVDKGYFQLENATFGSYGTDPTANVFTVGRNGTLNGDGTVRAETIDVSGTLLPGFYMDKGYHSYVKGKTLTLDASDSLTFTNTAVYKPMLWSDGDANLVIKAGAGITNIASDASIFLNFRPGNYQGVTQNYTTLPGFMNVSKAGFIDADYTSASGDIQLNGLVENYFLSHASEGNQRVGRIFDNIIASGGVNDEFWDYLVDLSFLEEAGMSEVVKKSYTQVAGSHRANMMTLALMNPVELSFKHIGQGLRYNRFAKSDGGTIYRMQNDRKYAPVGYGISSQNLWVQPYYRSLNTESDENCLGYNVRHSGVLVGTDRAISRGVNVGYFAGYSQPQLRADGYSGDVHDYSFGVVGKGHLHNGWEWMAWGTAGYQHYGMRRSMDSLGASGLSHVGSLSCPPLSATSGDDTDKQMSGKTDGWNMGYGLEIAKILKQRPGQFEWLRYRPFMAFEYSHAYQDGFVESCPTPNTFLLNYADENFDRTQFRMGASALLAFQRMDMEMRIMYTCLLGGDAAPSSGAAFASMPDRLFSVDGVNLGYHALSLGMNGNIFLDARRSKIVNLTYEGSIGRHSTAHTAALGYTMLY